MENNIKEEFIEDEFILGQIMSNLRYTRFIENEKEREKAKKKLEQDFKSMKEYMIKKYGDLNEAHKKYN